VAEIEGRCIRHTFELADAHCRSCGNEFCNECLVYAFGTSKPPYCVACALAAAGVRSNAGLPPKVSRRESRRREKEMKRANKAAKQSARSDAPKVEWTVPAAADGDDDFEWVDAPAEASQVSF
jgi:hypothetical protein